MVVTLYMGGSFHLSQRRAIYKVYTFLYYWAAFFSTPFYDILHFGNA